MEDFEDQLPAPNIGEIGRNVIRLTNEIIEMRRELAQTYVRVDVWQTTEVAAGKRVGELEQRITDFKASLEKETVERKQADDKQQSQRDSDRRLIVTAIIGPIIVAVLSGLILQAMVH